MKEIHLLPEELFYLGKRMGNGLIDYAYVAAMKDIRQRTAAQEDELRDSLRDKQLLTEDFMGNRAVSKEAKELLEPVFFGKTQTVLQLICMEPEEEDVQRHSFHYYEGRVTAVTGEPGGFRIFKTDREGVRMRAEQAAALAEETVSEEATNEFSEESVRDMICAKATGPFGDIVRIFCGASGVFFETNTEQKTLNRTALADKLFETLWRDENGAV